MNLKSNEHAHRTENKESVMFSGPDQQVWPRKHDTFFVFSSVNMFISVPHINVQKSRNGISGI